MTEIQILTHQISCLNNLLGRLVDLLAISQPQFFTSRQLRERYMLSERQLNAAISRCGIQVISGRVAIADVQRLDKYFHGRADFSPALVADGGNSITQTQGGASMNRIKSEHKYNALARIVVDGREAFCFPTNMSRESVNTYARTTWPAAREMTVTYWEGRAI